MICSECGADKPSTEFYASRRSKQCKACEHEKRREHSRAHPEQAQRVRRDIKLRRYGLTQADYDAMVAAQGGCCAICLAPGDLDPSSRFRLGVDHNHATGRVRGLLCRLCNRAIGIWHDDPEIVARAAAYLAR
jgi:hypothetical protein